MNQGWYLRILTVVLASAPSLADETPPADVGPVPSVTIQMAGADGAVPPPKAPGFSARFSAGDLRPLLTDRTDLLPLPLQFKNQRAACLDALDRISMEALVQKLLPFLKATYPQRFSEASDLIIAPVPDAARVTLDAPFLPSGQYTGPLDEVIGFQLHGINEAEYVTVAIRVLQAARLLLDTGDPAVDRTSPQYYQLAAGRELATLRAAYQAERSEADSAKQVRQHIGEALGIIDENGKVNEAKAKWVKESRRFTYVVKKGKFIDKLQPLVDDINREITMAGYMPGPAFLTDHPGITFDPDLGDVEILLPRSMLNMFLGEADLLERRMAEDAMITIEAVRLTDRDILANAVASRLNFQIQGVHNIKRHPGTQGILRQAGINALTAIANRELQVTDLSLVAAGTLPAGLTPIQVPALNLPPLATGRTATTIGTTFSIGADDIFFDGREQRYGFSYIGPDGIEHTMSYDVVDSLRDFWERIERNLIVHKIKKDRKSVV